MRTVRFELLRPDEIIEERNRCPLAYLPIGPLEWHGPHLPLGTDPLHAEAVARGAAEITGGVVLPTFYWGTEMQRSKKMLKNIGFTGDEWIVGMDFPANSMPSLYATEDVFSIMVREYLRLLVIQGYKFIIIVNGHGGENHLRVLDNLAKEYTAAGECTVMCALVATAGDETVRDNSGDAGGHATLNETSIISYLHPESVDPGLLPPKGEPIRNVDWAIVDGATFNGSPIKDYTVREDPREAAPEKGRIITDKSIRKIVELINRTVK